MERYLGEAEVIWKDFKLCQGYGGFEFLNPQQSWRRSIGEGIIYLNSSRTDKEVLACEIQSAME